MTLGLNKWRDLLVTKSLPVLDSNLAIVKAQMANPQLALADYARPILNDAALTGQLLKVANQSRLEGGREPLTTLGNALSHLGRSQLEQQMAMLIGLEQSNLPQSNREGYHQTLAAACHASELALDWGRQRNVHQPEEMQLAALLHFLPELMLWCHGGQVMPEIKQRSYGLKQDYESAAEKVLGCSIRALGTDIAKAWALPELVVQGLSVKQQDFTLASGAMLAGRLARRVQHSWYDRSTRQCLDDIARYKGHKLSDVEPQLHQNAVALSDHFTKLGFAPPARLLPMLVDEDYVDPKYASAFAQQAMAEHKNNTAEDLAQTGHNTVTRTALSDEAKEQAQISQPAKVSNQVAKSQNSRTSPEHTRPDISPELAKKLVSIKAMIKQHAHARELIQAVVEAIQISGFERVVFAVKVPQKKILYGRFFAYAEDIDPFKEFIISIAQPNLFSLLMTKPQQLWLNGDNRGKYWSRVPDSVKLMLQNNSFMIKSIFTKKHSVGLVYADHTQGDLDMKNYKLFQLLCKLLVDGMIDISHHHDH